MSIAFTDEVEDALTAVKNDNDSEDWLVCKFTDKKAKEITLVAKGTGNDSFLAEFKEDECLFALVRVTFTDDSRDDTGGKPRVKFARVTYAGPNANVMLKGKLATASNDIGQKFDIAAVHLESNESLDELAKEISFDKIIETIKKSNF